MHGYPQVNRGGLPLAYDKTFTVGICTWIAGPLARLRLVETSSANKS